MSTRIFEILLVEDNPSDVLVIRETLETKPGVALTVAKDGEAAARLLGLHDASAPPRLPSLIIMDLNMPRKHGRELLQEIKAHPRVLHIPVVVLTTSSAESDLLNAYRLQASGFVTKPFDLYEFTRTVEGILSYWTAISRPPG